MKLSIILILCFPFLLDTIVFAQDPPQCGSDAGGALCPNYFCCSFWGFCGNTSVYCEGGCQSQCWNSPPPPSPSPPPPPPSPPPPSPPPPSPPPPSPSPPPPSPPPPSPPPPSPPPPSPPPPSPPPPSPSPPPPPPVDPERPDHRCGPALGNPPCRPGRCCSIHNYCGHNASYCSGSNCRYQCWDSARLTDLPRALLRPSNNLNGISNIISESLFNEMFKHRKDCPSRGFYSYEAFITAAGSFPSFCTSGDVATRKRELAAFLSYTSQATTGQWFDSVDPHAWGYCHINGTTIGSENEQFCTSSNWPCASGKKYDSRGPIQLTHNYNYGLAGEALGIDLINDPDLVATDSIVSFKTAIWFWMTEHGNNPSFHDILINANSKSNDQVGSYGMISSKTNSNFGHQSGLGIVTTSIGYYKRYCDMLEVSYGDNLQKWFEEPPFSKVVGLKMSVM